MLLFPALAHAEIRYDAPVVTVSGKIAPEVYRTLAAIVASGPVSTVIFKDSSGGSFDTGIEIGKLIAEKKINTVVEGICASACAVAFLGGETRGFSSEQPESALMFHPGFARTSHLPAEETKAVLFDWFEARTHHAPAPAMIAAMDDIKARKGGVYVLSPSHSAAIKKGASVFFCDGSEAGISHCAAQGASTAGTMFITAPGKAP